MLHNDGLFSLQFLEKKFFTSKLQYKGGEKKPPLFILHIKCGGSESVWIRINW